MTTEEELTLPQSTHEEEQWANTAHLLARRGTIMQTKWQKANLQVQYNNTGNNAIPMYMENQDKVSVRNTT
jgi:hypothetical protein